MSNANKSVIIRNGRVIDPANDRDFTADIAIQDGVITAISSKLDSQTLGGCFEEFDATDCLVTPGLIDLHVHVYEHATPLGMNVDQFCLKRGVTTVVDAGSAGAATFPGLRKFIAESSKTRVLSLLHIVPHGLASAGCVGIGSTGGEIDSLNQVSVENCVECIQQNRDMIVGVKLRLGEEISNNGKNENEAYRLSWVIVSRRLETRDIYTHCFNGLKGSIVDPKSQSIHPSVRDAKNRGVIFDIGHGVNSFTWTVAEICGRNSFWPDTISTDLHILSIPGPAYDLPTIMTKMLNIGMPLNDVIKAVTSTPAKAIGWESRIGSLSVGNVADVTVMKIEQISTNLEDSQAQLREMTQRLVPLAVWREGTRYEVELPDNWPNPSILSERAEWWRQLEVKDEIPPSQICE